MNFNISDNLEIILITYNRKEKLKNIVSDILDYNSPIRNCKITFLDNCSTDGTSEFLSELSKNNNNIRHIRHEINIGGSANLVRGYEYVSKKYFWMLCDDDRLDFTNWEKIESALKSDKYDIVETYTDPRVFSGDTYEDKLSKLIVEIVLLPAAIYKSEYLTDEVIFNSYINLYTLVPHMALISAIVNNKNHNIYFFNNYDEQIVLQGYSDANYKRGYRKDIHPIIKSMDLTVGFAISLSMIHNKVLRYKCIDRIRSYFGLSFQGFVAEMPYYWISAGLNDNLMAIYNVCSEEQRKSFIDRISQLREELKKYNRNILTLFNIHIFQFFKIKNRIFSFSFIGFSKLINREHKKFYSLFSFSKEIYYLKIVLFFFIRITIKI